MAAPAPKEAKKAPVRQLTKLPATQESSLAIKHEETFGERARKVLNNSDSSLDISESDQIAFKELLEPTKRPKLETRQASLIHQIMPSDGALDKLLSIKNKTKKRSWNSEEDQKLIELV